MDTGGEEEGGNEEEEKAFETKVLNTYKIYGTFKNAEETKTPDYVKEIIKVYIYHLHLEA